MTPQRCDTVAQLREATSGNAGAHAVVMTMGALHEGHAALIRAARDRVGAAGCVTVTIFVNPLQFGAGEDFSRYPRTIDADLALCVSEGVDAVFTPAPEQMYPRPPQVGVAPGPLAEELEGAARPGHFAGVLTVVLKLVHLTRATVAAFGEKDYQQLTLVRRMTADLDVPVDILAVPTVRQPDGLALSSRNQYLSAGERRDALALSAALAAGAAAAASGSRAALAAAQHEWAQRCGAALLDYLELRGPELGPAPAIGPARLLIAASLGGNRLLDNAPCELGGGAE